MIVTHTAEVRWFCRGPLPDAVAAWFDAHGPASPVERRTDHYLAPTDPALGVKVRDGRIEAKRREAVLATVHAGARVERWTKWSFPLAGGAYPDAGWVAVEKARRQRGARVDAGTCGMELTTAQVGGAAWWTVGLEAVGPDPAAALAAGAARWLAAPPPLGAPLGYPAWLLQQSEAPDSA